MAELFELVLCGFGSLCWFRLCWSVAESQRDGEELSLSVCLAADKVLVISFGANQLRSDVEGLSESVVSMISRQAGRVADGESGPRS